MPILRKGGQSIYFVHIPVTPVSNLYVAALEKGYAISNLGPSKGDLFDQQTAFSKKLYDQFGIRSFQKEGVFKYLTGSPQHATYVSWCHWGPFEKSVAVLRDPMERFTAAVKARYPEYLKKTGQDPSQEVFAAFQQAMLDYMKNAFPKKQYAYENAFRSMMPYLLPQTILYPYTPKGMTGLAKELSLGSIDCTFDLAFELTDKALIEHAQDLYAEDIAFYRSRFGEEGAL